MDQIGRWGRWLDEARLAWWTLGVIFVAVAAIAGHQASERSFRVAGLGLQLAGLLATAYGISKTRLFFGQPGLFAQAGTWWSRAPWKTPPIQTLSMTGIASGTSFGEVHLTSARPPGASLETRVAVLEANLQSLSDAFLSAKQEMRRRDDELAGALEEEKRSRAIAQREIEDRLKEAQTGGLGEARMGLIWVLLGSYLAAGSVELAASFG